VEQVPIRAAKAGVRPPGKLTLILLLAVLRV